MTHPRSPVSTLVRLGLRLGWIRSRKVLTPSGLASLRSSVLEATGAELDDGALRTVYRGLPWSLQALARLYGLDDSHVADAIFDYLWNEPSGDGGGARWRRLQFEIGWASLPAY
ncbi:MAG TPA: hypothetical protein VM369_03025 [Candidatus Binatia bacterium]|nr:hypothetical protein [Candidatus Binatia bacterium]